jgi:hypothetical protein
MKRFLKISRLLKIAQESNNAVWQEIIDEARSEGLPAQYTGIKAAVDKSGEVARNLLIGIKGAKENVKANPIPKDVAADLSNLINDREKLKGFVAAANSGTATAAAFDNSSFPISKRAGFFGSMWSGVKGLASGIGAILRWFPFIGIFLAVYHGLEDFEEVQKSSDVIKNNFSSLGDKEKLFNAEYISELITKYNNDPDKMLEITQLNKIARFYSENFYMVWADVAWFISDLVAIVLIVAATVTTAGIGGVALVILETIATALGLGGAAAAVSVEYFDALLSGFDENKERIVKIAQFSITNKTDVNNDKLLTSNDSESPLIEPHPMDGLLGDT